MFSLKFKNKTANKNSLLLKIQPIFSFKKIKQTIKHVKVRKTYLTKLITNRIRQKKSKITRKKPALQRY